LRSYAVRKAIKYPIFQVKRINHFRSYVETIESVVWIQEKDCVIKGSNLRLTYLH